MVQDLLAALGAIRNILPRAVRVRILGACVLVAPIFTVEKTKMFLFSV